MALKSSQPRCSASTRSERPILRTTYVVETPKNCSFGLAKYGVDMAPPSLLVVAGNGAPLHRAHPSHARKSRVSPANQVQQEGALPDDTVATGAVNLARYAVEARQHSRLGE